ncbi:hypothetical protein QTN47_21220 [Danxiaibacter flavus]|uniref:histidine kinase n=1 Tax=Danxiaibacter flavus TaxID=3049108 RepID=A0ABV3ZLQ0_9BACT|nr:hypothetical protein QNM32_21225 [Chitinophagaceae bacterium DXS]
METQERTLQHINYELNNNINQVASVIKMTLHTVDISDNDKTAKKLEEMTEMTRQLMAGVKTLSFDIELESIANTNLFSALTHETGRINRAGSLPVVFECSSEPIKLEHTKTLIAYRIAQMILDNAIMHSHAKQINIKLHFTKNLITLTLKDDGRGFDVEKTLSTNTSGGLMKAMRRAKMINSKLTITSVVGVGTTVIIKIPCV